MLPNAEVEADSVYIKGYAPHVEREVLPIERSSLRAGVAVSW